MAQENLLQKVVEVVLEKYLGKCFALRMPQRVFALEPVVQSENALTDQTCHWAAQVFRLDVIAEVGLQKVLNVSRIDCTNLAQLRPGS